MTTPPYFEQKHQSACSLAVLRSVLAQKSLNVSEEELLEKVIPDYGQQFRNLWNPTIAKLACEYGIDTMLGADWPLLREDLLGQALEEFETNPNTMNIQKYENPNDLDALPEPLPLAYKEMFAAIKLGCKTSYDRLTAERLANLLQEGRLVQTSIKTQLLYPGDKAAFHSVLIYEIHDNEITYHDPARKPAMICTVDAMISAANGTGAYLSYKIEP